MSGSPEPRRRDYRSAWREASKQNLRLAERVRELEEDLRELKRHLYRLLREREEVAGPGRPGG